jgi:Na+/H+ antiporter NhaD/arsenite permease-like protein
MSNVAQVIVFAPVIGGLADALNINPLLLGIPMTLGASCAGMLPMGTPPNAIVFASGHIKLKQMIRTGAVMNIISGYLNYPLWLVPNSMVNDDYPVAAFFASHHLQGVILFSGKAL